MNLWGGGRPENHGASPYVVSKDAIRTFTRFVAEEEREWNVCVVAFSPKQAIATEDAARRSAQAPAGPALGNGFVLAAQAGMEMTGKTVEHRDGKFVAVIQANSLSRNTRLAVVELDQMTQDSQLDIPVIDVSALVSGKKIATESRGQNWTSMSRLGVLLYCRSWCGRTSPAAA